MMGEQITIRHKGLTAKDTAKRTNSPPLQGRGKGWGLSVERNATIATHARAMRNNATEPEKRLWSVLSSSQLGGHKFRRQAAIAGFIADFLSPQKGLIVEVDGQTHTNPISDAPRTARLESLGYRVVRVTNADVMGNLEGVQQHLLDTLETMPDRRAPHPNPSPEGEGLTGDAGQSIFNSKSHLGE